MITNLIPEWQEAAAAVEFVARLSQEIADHDRLHRRADDRVPIAVPVKIELLGESLNPVGSPFYGITRDVSRAGLGIYHTQKMSRGDDDTLFVQISVEAFDKQDTVVVVGQVRHTKTVGQFEHTGIEFLFGVDDDE